MKKYLILLIFLLGRAGTLFAQTNDTLITNVSKEFKIWKTITIGGQTTEELVSLLEKKKFDISLKNQILEEFSTKDTKDTINLVTVTPKQLGITRSYSFATLYQAAAIQGLDICPRETVLHLALQEFKKIHKEIVYIAIDPLSESFMNTSSVPVIFRVYADEFYGRNIEHWNDSTIFNNPMKDSLDIKYVFMLPKKETREIAFLPKAEIASNASLSVSSGMNTLKVWDDGTVDGDIVDIYIDNVLQKRDVVLSNKPLIIPITVDRISSIDFIVKNEGSKPPCTMSCLLQETKESFTLHGKVDKQLNIVLKAK